MSSGSASRPVRFEPWRLATVYIGVVLAFVPDNSYGSNEAVLNQIILEATFQ